VIDPSSSRAKSNTGTYRMCLVTFNNYMDIFGVISRKYFRLARNLVIRLSTDATASVALLAIVDHMQNSALMNLGDAFITTKSTFVSFTSLAAMVVAAGITMTAAPKPAAACSDDSYTGTICSFGFNFCPYGWLRTDGTIYQISEFQALFSLLGNNYGGDARTTFGVPDLRGRSVVGAGMGPGLIEIPLGTKVGAQQVVISLSQLPKHNHDATFTSSGGGSSGGGTATGTVSLPVTGSVKVGSSNPASKSTTLAQKSVLVQPTVGSVAIYGPAGSTADVQLGPDGAVTGIAQGSVTLNVTGGGSSGGGTVTVENAGASAPVVVQSPVQAATYCIQSMGLYPRRPS
jgi:microcystin-dependent protein